MKTYFLKSFFLLGLFLFLNIPISANQILGPLDLIFVEYDKQIDSIAHNDVLVINTLVDLKPQVAFNITNAQYFEENEVPLWDLEANTYINYSIQYQGLESIKAGSTLRITTLSPGTGNNNLMIEVNGRDETINFEIVKLQESKHVRNDFLVGGSESIYLLQGTFYRENTDTYFMGSVMHGLIWESNELLVPPQGMNIIGFDPNDNHGSNGPTKDECDCDRSNLIGDPNNWNNGQGSQGNDASDSKDDDNCICPGIIYLEEIGCVVSINIGDSQITCSEDLYYEWYQVFDDPDIAPILIGSGGPAFALTEILPFQGNFTGYIQLVVICGDNECTLESDVLFIDCFMCTATYNVIPGNCALYIQTTNCINPSITWYYGPTLNSMTVQPMYQNLTQIIISQNGYYNVEIACEGCTLYTSTIHSFQNCEPVCDDEISISSEIEMVDVDDYCVSPENQCLTEITNLVVTLPDGNTLDLLSVGAPFGFPYCLNSCSGEGNGPPCTIPNTSWEYLDDHINSWLINNGYLGTANWVPNNTMSPCHTHGGFPYILEILDTNVEFNYIIENLHNNSMGSMIQKDFFQYNPHAIPSGNIVLTVNDICPGGNLTWSDGSTENPYIVPTNGILTATVVCPDGCIYTADIDLDDPCITAFLQFETNELFETYYIKSFDLNNEEGKVSHSIISNNYNTSLQGNIVFEVWQQVLGNDIFFANLNNYESKYPFKQRTLSDFVITSQWIETLEIITSDNGVLHIPLAPSYGLNPAITTPYTVNDANLVAGNFNFTDFRNAIDNYLLSMGYTKNVNYFQLVAASSNMISVEFSYAENSGMAVGISASNHEFVLSNGNTISHYDRSANDGTPPFYSNNYLTPCGDIRAKISDVCLVSASESCGVPNYELSLYNNITLSSPSAITDPLEDYSNIIPKSRSCSIGHSITANIACNVASYQWSTVDGVIIGPTDGQSIQIDGDGVYEVTVDCGGCTFTGSVTIENGVIFRLSPEENNPLVMFSPLTTGLSLNEEEVQKIYPRSGISIFPNPAKDIFNVSLTVPNPNNYQIELFDSRGRSVKSLQKSLGAGKHQFELNLADQPSGIYILNVTTDKEVLPSQKLILVH